MAQVESTVQGQVPPAPDAQQPAPDNNNIYSPSFLDKLRTALQDPGPLKPIAPEQPAQEGSGVQTIAVPTAGGGTQEVSLGQPATLPVEPSTPDATINTFGATSQQPEGSQSIGQPVVHTLTDTQPSPEAIQSFTTTDAAPAAQPVTETPPSDEVPEQSVEEPTATPQSETDTTTDNGTDEQVPSVNLSPVIPVAEEAPEQSESTQGTKPETVMSETETDNSSTETPAFTEEQLSEVRAYLEDKKARAVQAVEDVDAAIATLSQLRGGVGKLFMEALAVVKSSQSDK